MVELIITEKPKSALRIAQSLAEGKLIKEMYKGVAYYKLRRNNKDLVIACAVGHLFSLGEVGKKRWSYPVFDIVWKPSYEISKSAAYSRKYLETIEKLCKNTDEYTIATDYDIEGEVIGLNCIRYICKQRDSARMKFSTLTKNELIEAYENKSKHLDWGLALAGEARHLMDWFWGINTSRALTAAIKKDGMFKILSSGRVQGPALKIIVEKELEIKGFKTVPYWQIELEGDVKNGKITAWHSSDKFWDVDKANEVIKNVHGQKNGKIAGIDKREFLQNAPFPFDLTTLQTEAYRCFGINPKDTLAIAQNLYLAGLISYPRTSSQILPPSIGYRKIIAEITKQSEYKELCLLLEQEKALTPHNGKKTDPAHPAIFPTGELPKDLHNREKKIYDLIVKRMLSTFGKSAERVTMSITIDVNSELFVAKGTRTAVKGWHVFYQPYLKLEEEELVKVEEGEQVKIIKIELHAEETKPPKRYTPASIVRELERKNLGTKSTRADVVDTLYQRGYTKGKAITATELGIKTVEILEKYSPKILDEELTRHFEVEMEEIREGKKKKEEVIEEAKDVLKRILKDFKGKEKEIGAGLRKANIETRNLESNLGLCLKCGIGNIILRRGKFGRFGACSKYPECKTTFKLPSSGMINPSKNLCEQCKHPMIIMVKKGKRPQEVCINPACPSKHVDESLYKDKACNKCGKGKMILRKSVYGSFLACNQYPKCKNIENLTKKIDKNSMK